MTFEDNVEKCLFRCLAAAGALRDPVNNDYDGVSLLLGLSGGIDSSALLLALKSISQKKRSLSVRSGLGLGLEVSACHVNHHLRGADSAADEQFCRELCEKLAVPLIVVDLEEVRESEAELRAARYEKLMRVAKQLSAPYIVTAHNLDDQVETLIFRLLRGTSLRGLVGMSLARPMEASLWPVLLRPLLETGREEIEQYLAQQGTAGRLDLSNNDVRYTRNFLRKQIIAPLKERFPGLSTNVEHFRLALHSENDYMTAQAAALFSRALSRPNKLLLSVLEGEHPALIARVITTYIEQAGLVPSFQRVNRVMKLIEQAGCAADRNFATRTSLGENLELLVSKDSILLKPLLELTVSAEEYAVRLQSMPPVLIKMPRPGRSSAITVVPWLNYALSIVEVKDAKQDQGKPFERTALAALVDLTGVPDTICVRPRRPGDHLQPVGMREQVRLKQYLHANKGLFAGARSLLPALNEVLGLRLFPVLALVDSQEVLWVPGFGLSEKIKSGPASHLLSLVPLAPDAQEGLPGEISGGFNDGTC
jgi:tRNA(Ile)-lysidine synthase